MQRISAQLAGTTVHDILQQEDRPCSVGWKDTYHDFAGSDNVAFGYKVSAQLRLFDDVWHTPPFAALSHFVDGGLRGNPLWLRRPTDMLSKAGYRTAGGARPDRAKSGDINGSGPIPSVLTAPQAPELSPNSINSAFRWYRK